MISTSPPPTRTLREELRDLDARLSDVGLELLELNTTKHWTAERAYALVTELGQLRYQRRRLLARWIP